MHDHLRINLTYAEAWVLREALRDYITEYATLPRSRRPYPYTHEPAQSAHRLFAFAESVLYAHRLSPSREGLN